MILSEYDLQRACVEWFEDKYPEYEKLLFAVPNGATLQGGGRTWNVLKTSGCKTGVSDLLLLCPNQGVPVKPYLLLYG